MIDRVQVPEGVQQQVPAGEFQIWMVLQGHGSLTFEAGSQGPAEPTSFGVGDTVLIPAELKEAHLHTDDDCTWLEVSYPVASPLAGFEV
jgi:hypothetical protein